MSKEPILPAEISSVVKTVEPEVEGQILWAKNPGEN